MTAPPAPAELYVNYHGSIRYSMSFTLAGAGAGLGLDQGLVTDPAAASPSPTGATTTAGTLGGQYGAIATSACFRGLG